MKSEENFSVINKTKKGNPSVDGLPFEKIKNAVVGKNFELSLVFIGDALSQSLNKKYRNINKPTNILSFNVAESTGEIFINLKKAKKEALLFGRNFPNFIAFLFIHALFHLKGFEHSSKMEGEEARTRKKFKI